MFIWLRTWPGAKFKEVAGGFDIELPCLLQPAGKASPLIAAIPERYILRSTSCVVAPAKGLYRLNNPILWTLHTHLPKEP